MRSDRSKLKTLRESSFAGRVFSLNPTEQEKVEGSINIHRPGAVLELPSGRRYWVAPSGAWHRIND